MEREIFFCAEGPNKGFYFSDIHKNIPQNCIVISEEEHKNALEHMCLGKTVSVIDGKLYFSDPVILKEDIERLVLRNRQKLLSESDWTILPDAPFTKEQKDEWKIYRQALRDITEQEGFPENVVFPEAPVFKKTTE